MIRDLHLHVVPRAEVPWESLLISLTDVSVDNSNNSNIIRLDLRTTTFSLSWAGTSDGRHRTHICRIRTGERDKPVDQMAKILDFAVKRKAWVSLVTLRFRPLRLRQTYKDRNTRNVEGYWLLLIDPCSAGNFPDEVPI